MKTTIFTCYLFIVFITLIEKIFSENCGLEFLKKPKRILINQGSDDNTRYLKGEKNWQNIKIHLDFSKIENNIGKFNKNDLIYLRDYIMKKAKDVFEKLIQVRPVGRKLKLLSEVCDEVPIPDFYREKEGGVDADLVIFVALDDTGFYKANRIEAAATYCLQDEATKRPIAGFINFRPGIDIKNSTSLDYMVWLALHEMTHIFVFNDALYEDFIDENFQPLNLTEVLGSKLLENGKKMNYLKTKKILEKGQKHFNCTHLEGVPLEFMGGSGTAGSHWSKKIMNTDFMIGDSYGENLISEISLALFEDSGWYKVEYELANLFLWGKDKGCNFFDFSKKCIREKKIVLEEKEEILNTSSNNNTDVNNEDKGDELDKDKDENEDGSKKDKDEIEEKTFFKDLNTTKFKANLVNKNNNSKIIFSKNKNANTNNEESARAKKNETFNLVNYETDFSPEFCTKLNYPVCSTSHIFRGICRIRRYKTPLSAFESFFKDKSVGGANNLAGKCPIATEDKQNNLYYSGSCRKGTLRSTQLSIEKICPECSCFMSNLVPLKKENDKYEKAAEDKVNNNLRKFQLRKQTAMYPSNENLRVENAKTIKTLSDSKFESIINIEVSLNNEDSETEETEEDENSNEYEDLKDSSDINKKNRIDKKMKYKKKKVNIPNINKDLIPTLTEEDYKAMCFEFKCHNDKLFVLIDNKEYDCDKKNINIPGYKGNVVCPPFDVLCDRRYKCKFGCTEKYENNRSANEDINID